MSSVTGRKCAHLLWPPLKKNLSSLETSLVVQRLRLHAFDAGDVGSIPGLGTKIPHAVQCSQEIFKK